MKRYQLVQTTADKVTAGQWVRGTYDAVVLEGFAQKAEGSGTLVLKDTLGDSIPIHYAMKLEVHQSDTPAPDAALPTKTGSVIVIIVRDLYTYCALKAVLLDDEKWHTNRRAYSQEEIYEWEPATIAQINPNHMILDFVAEDSFESLHGAGTWASLNETRKDDYTFTLLRAYQLLLRKSKKWE